MGWEFGHAFRDSNGNADAVDLFLDEVKEFPNISCAVFDDFVWLKGEQSSLEESRKFHERFRNNDIKRLDTWMVLYTHNYGTDPDFDETLKPHLALFDGLLCGLGQNVMCR